MMVPGTGARFLVRERGIQYHVLESLLYDRLDVRVLYSNVCTYT